MENNDNKIPKPKSETRVNDLSSRLKIGFSLILVLILILAVTNIFQLQKTKQQLNAAVATNITKMAHGAIMRDSIRLRTISMYKMLQTEDYFIRDEEVVNFYAFAQAFREARKKTIMLGVSPFEKELDRKIIEQTALAQPITRKTVESLFSELPILELKEMVANATKSQEKLYSLLNELNSLQQQQSKQALNDINENFYYTIILTIILTVIVILISVQIATRIYRHVIDTNNTLAENNIKLSSAYIKAEESTKTKSEFLAKMSHEIRTPMNGVMGMLQLLLTENLDSTQKDYAETALSSSRSLLTIINDILDFSKMEAGKFDINNSPLSLSTLLNRVISTVEIPALEKNIKLNYLIQPDVEEYYNGDENRISQVLINLIGNAIKFTDKGGVSINISINESSDISSLLYIEIMDTGIGISDEAKKNLFIPFNQADNTITREYGGTGLGLAICKQLCSLMGGEIGVIDGKNGGSIFWITLNLERIKEQQNTMDEINSLQNMETEKTISPNEDTDEAKKKILIVEDKKVNQQVAVGILKKLNYSSELAEHGKIAIEKVQLSDYDLILMDCHMPYMDGYEATRQIRLLQKEAKAAHCPIVAVTGNAMLGDKEKCLDAGMDDFLAKPFTVKEISNIIEKWLTKDSE